MTSSEELSEVLGVGRITDDDLQGILVSLFSLARWESGNRVTYFDVEHGEALHLDYNNRGQIVGCEPGPGLTEVVLTELRSQVEAAMAPDVGYEVRRAVAFSRPELKGYWRHGDDWQILPAPPHAPRPGFLLGEHPFIVEYRVRTSSSNAAAITRRRKRYWELHLLLTLFLRGVITSEATTGAHHWVLLSEPTGAGSQTVYANEGYVVGGDFVGRAEDFTDPSEYARLDVTPDEEYYDGRGIDRDDLDVPASLDTFFERFDGAPPRTRDRLLRAGYWLDAASRAWYLSKALSYIAAIAAVESLVPKGKPERCTLCGLDRSPGPTQRFKDFVEEYASAEAPEHRTAMYRLRSVLVHGEVLHSLDVPGSWGALVPNEMKQLDLHDAAFTVSRAAVRNWFLNETA